MPNQETARHALGPQPTHIFHYIYLLFNVFRIRQREHCPFCWPATTGLETSVINQTQLAGGPEEFRSAAAAFAGGINLCKRLAIK